MSDVKHKVSPNVRITQEQKNTILELAKQSKNTYSDMFRIILTIGIEHFKNINKI